MVEHSDKTSAEEYLKQISRHAGEEQITLLMEAGEETDSIAFGELYAAWRLSRSDTDLEVGPSDGFREASGD